MTTLRQIQANQRNAELSTGPTSDEGKAQSRRNALKHGLAGAGVVLPEDAEAEVAERLERWKAEFRPATDQEDTTVAQVVVHVVRLERCMRHDFALRDRYAKRARLCWDEDRRLAVEQLASGLRARPGLVQQQLCATRHGADWLIGRWDALGRLLDESGTWDETRRSLALDLLGVPHELREGRTRLDPAPGGDPLDARRAVVREEVERLTRARDGYLDELDAHDRALAEVGLGAELSAPIQQLARYESRCDRVFHRGMAQLMKMKKDRSAAVSPPPAARRPPTTPSAAPDDAIVRRLASQLAALRDEPSPPPPGPPPEPVPSPSMTVFAPAPATLPAPARSLAQSVRSSILGPAPTGNRHARRRRQALAGRS